MAKVKKREDGRYQRSITIGYTPDRKQKRKIIYAKKQKELEKKVAEFQQSRLNGLDTSNENMTFGELAEVWFEKYKPAISVNTRKKYRTQLDLHLLPSLANCKLKELKPIHLQSIVNEMAEDDYATASMREVKVTAAQVMEVAFENDMVKRNVFEKVKVPKIDPTERRPLTSAETALVERTFQDHRMESSQ